MQLNQEQVGILDHTVNRAANRLFCGGSPSTDQLVRLGLMESAGRKSFVPDEYFRINSKGRDVLKQSKSKE